MPDGVELKGQDVADLVELLRQHSLSAIDRFKSMSPQLRRRLSKDSYEIVRGQIDNLQFSEAVKGLEGCQQ